MAMNKSGWIFFLFFNTPLFSQVIVHGVVQNNGAEPVVNAQVEIINQVNSDQRFAGFTNAGGHYSIAMTTTVKIARKPDGLYIENSSLFLLRVSGRGVETYEVPDISIKSDTTINVTVYRILKDIDGNVYRAVKIGGQWWMRENLRVTHYRNVDDINYKQERSSSYCNDYNNDSSGTALYGRYYNWLACVDSRQIAPNGWHVPSMDEWGLVINTLGGSAIAGGRLKETGTLHWFAPNTDATNESDFAALPAGVDGGRQQRGEIAFFWSSSAETSDMLPPAKYGFAFYYNNAEAAFRREGYSLFGSVRCVRDSIPIAACFTVTPLSGSTVTEFRFDASASTDELDEPSQLQVRWDWENDGVWDTPFSATKTVTHCYPITGFKDIKLEVRNTYGFSAATLRQRIWVGNMTHVTDARVLPMAIGDKWCYEKRYFHRGYNIKTIDEYTPFVFTVLDTATVNGAKIFVVEQLEIPSYNKSRENWYSDTLVFKRNDELLYDRQILEDRNLNYQNEIFYGFRVKIDTLGELLCKAETSYWNYWHAGNGIDRSCTVAEGIGIVSMSDHHSSASEQRWFGTDYELMSAPNLPSGKPLHCFILKMVNTQNGLNTIWNKSLEDDISYYRIFVNDRLADSTASASDTSRVLHLPPAADQSIAVAAVNNAHIMSNYHNQKLSDFDKPPAAFNLLSPANYQTVALSWDAAIVFKWEPAFEDDDKLVTYVFHVHGENLDSTISGLKTAVISLRCPWRENTSYSWSVQATDGLLITSSPESIFRVAYTAAFNLLSPVGYETVALSWDAAIAFKWEPVSDDDDTLVTYIFHVRGEDLDSTLTGLKTTEISMSRQWREHVEYSWSVHASNGLLSISSPENFFQIVHTAAVNLLSPSPGQLLTLSSDSTIAFTWEPTLANEDQRLSYLFHIQGGIFDSTLAGLHETEVILRGRWQENIEYSWSVTASNGPLSIASPVNTLQVLFAIFESPCIYPNPFNVRTNIFYRLAAAEKINLTIYNARGQKICTLWDGVQAAGPHIISWSGNDETWNRVTSGIYFLVLLQEGKRHVQKMLLLR